MSQIIDDPVNEYIRQQIRLARLKRRLSVRQAAHLSDIPESSYSCLENGFYRISLLNLKKILDALEIGIGEVWPLDAPQDRAHEHAMVPDVAAINSFRFNELVNLSCSETAALVARHESLHLIYSANLTDAEHRELKESIMSGLRRDWRIFSKQSRGVTVYLCLKGAVLEDYVKRLIGIYLDLWLAMELAAAR